jgi:tRNA pseudouridine13 synthase
MSAVREREDDGVSERLSKRPRTTEELAADIMEDTPSISAEGKPDSVLPPSHALLAAPRHAGSTDGPELRIMETDVGISEYVGNDIPQIQGIIKQR